MPNKIIQLLIKTTLISLLLSLFVSPALAKHDRLAINPTTGAIVVGGTDGTIYRFPAATPGNLPWDEHNQGGAHFNAVIYASNLFVAVADSSTLWYSSDGTTWYPPKKMTSGKANFSAIAYGAGTFVVVANDDGTSYYSTDNAETWEFGSGIGNKIYLNDIIYAEKQFIAVGQEGYGAAIYTSLNGQSWTPIKGVKVSYPLRAIAYASNQKNKFVAVGDYSTLWYSSDGQTWTQATEDKGGPHGNASFTDVTYDGVGMFVAVANKGTIWNSKDGVTWKIATTAPGATIGPGNTTFYSVASGTTHDVANKPYQVFVAVGDNSEIGGSSVTIPAIWYSTDGEVWGPAKGTKVCVRCDPGDKPTFGYPPLSAVAFNGSQFMAVPDYFLNGDFFPSYYSTSFDGQNWARYK